MTTIFQFSDSGAQSFGLQWAKDFAKVPSGNAHQVRDLIVDSNGNVYSTGTFSDTIDADPGPGVHYLIANSHSQDIFIIKLNSSGNLVWAKSIGGVDYDGGHALQLDQYGNLIITGGFIGLVDFDPGVGVQYENAPNLNGNIFILKLDTAGNFLWVKSIGGQGGEYGIDIDRDSSGYLYVTGTFQDTVDFDPGPGVHKLMSHNYAGIGLEDDIFVAKYDSLGNYIWAKHMGSNYQDRPTKIKIDHHGNVYTTGRFQASSVYPADFDPGPGTFNMIVTGWNWDDVFVSKLDANGNFIWAKSFGSMNTTDVANSIDVDQADNVYIAGVVEGETDFDPGPGIHIVPLPFVTTFDMAFIEKLDSAGNFVWVKTFTDKSTSMVKGMIIDHNNNIYVTGCCNDSLDLDPGIGVHYLQVPSGMYFAKLDSAGNFLNGFGIPDASGNSSPSMIAGLTLDKNENVYISNLFSYPTDFDPGYGTYIIIPGSFFNNGDFYIEKLAQCNTSSTQLSANTCNSYTLNGQTYSASGSYNQYFTNFSGCDSIITLNLSINNNSSTIINSACAPLTYNGQTYSSSGNYMQTYTNSLGCDSTLFLQLTINSPSGATMNTSNCGPYIFNGQTYSLSGVYQQTLVNAVGCDSLVTLNLTVQSPSYINLTQTACGNYTFNGTTYYFSGLYNQTYTNTVGCDSIITLDLTINNTSSSSISITSCGPYTINGQTYTTTGLYNQTFVNSVGCDSILHIILNIDNIDTTISQSGNILISQQTVATSYQWVKCPSFSIISGATSQTYTTTSNGSFAVIVTLNACTDTSACITVTGLGLDDDVPINSMTVSPNPTNGPIIISSISELNNVTIKMVNVLGETILQQEHLNGKKFNLNISTLANGFYFLAISNGGQTNRIKIQLEN